MFDNILNRVRSWGGRTAPSSPETPAPGAGPEASSASRTAKPGTSPAPKAQGPSRTPPSTAPRASDAIWHELRIRLGELRKRFDEDRGGTDLDALLDGVARAGAVIRQPPLAAQAVLTLSRRSSYGLDEMTTLFERDPAMSQALLRHSNSAWYAGYSQQPILSLKAAIQRVGTKGIHATVMHHVLQSELSRPGPGLDALARMVWEHMVRTAPLARGLAPFFGADGEEAFTLGLLHDVGKLVLFDRVSTERKKLRRDVRLPEGFLTACLSVLHEPLGGLAALEWGLDDRSARVIATHHRWGDHPADEPLSQVVFLAEAVDITRQRGERLDLNLLWEAGDLDGSVDDVAACLAQDMEELDEAERAHRRKLALVR